MICILSDIDWYKLVPVIPTTGAFIIAYFAYRRLILRQFRGKQLDEICNLINKIQEEKIFLRATLLYTDSDHKSKIDNKLTFFEISEYLTPYENVEGSTVKSILKYPEDEVLKFKEFSTHPLIPKKIADILNRLQDFPNATYWNFNIKTIAANTTIVEILPSEKQSKITDFFNTDKDDTELNFRVSNGSAYLDYNDFIKCSVDLINEINKWFHDNGIDDVNIRSTDKLKFTEPLVFKL